MSSLRNRFRRRSKTKEAKLIIIASEGQETEPDYFDELISSNNYGRSEVHVLRRDSSKSSPRNVVKELKNAAKKEYRLSSDDELWIVIDRDRWRDEELNEVVSECQKQNISVALSNPCFELWLLMHFCDLCKNADSKNRIVCKDKASLKTELTKILRAKKIDWMGMRAFMPSVSRAIINARKIDKRPQDRWPQTIGTRVYILVDNLIHP